MDYSSTLNLFLHILIAFGLLSTPIHFLFTFSAADIVVPDPQKKSATIFPSLDDAKIILFNNFSGFSVGYP